MENRKINYLFPLALAGTLILGLFIGQKLMVAAPETELISQGGSDYRKMQDIIKILDNRYVDSVNANALFEEAISDMLHKLDPHSSYISAKDLLAANEQIQGEFAGVGVRFFIIRDTVCITNVIENSPSSKAGLLAGDKIVKVDKEEITKAKIENDQVMSLLKGPIGSEVKVTVLRNGKKITKTVIRGAIPINSINTAYMLDDKTGFIKIDQFSLTTTTEFKNAARRLLNQGMKQLVLDLRNNGGGVLSSATQIADEFLRTNKVIVSTKGIHSDERKYMSTNVGMLENMKVAVLINENSASASEILAGALQDHDRATIIGRRSFGKGLVQEDVELRDGSNLRLTIARYYTPTGRCIQKEYNGNIEEYYHEQSDRYQNGELYAPDSSLFVDSLKFVTKGGKTVYGGGGIMPDKFVPLDTVGNTWYLTQLRYSSAFQSFAFDYVQSRRAQWKSIDHFVKSFQVSDELLKQFTNYGKKYYKIEFNNKEFLQSKSLMKELLKGEIARQIWTENGYFQVINQNDKEIREALKQF